MLTFGRIPEWPKGTDCKSAGDAFEGSNPSLPTTFHFMARSFRERVFLFPHPHDTGKGKRKRGSPSRMHKVFFLPDAGGETVLTVPIIAEAGVDALGLPELLISFLRGLAGNVVKDEK